MWLGIVVQHKNHSCTYRPTTIVRLRSTMASVSTINLNAPLTAEHKAVLDSLRMISLVDSRYDNKVVKSEMSKRARITVGVLQSQVSLINAKTSDRGYTPYVGISDNCEIIRKNLCAVQEVYLDAALKFATKDGKSSPEEWTLVRPFDESDKTVYINYNGVENSVILFQNREQPELVSNDGNYTGQGMCTLNPRVTINAKEGKIVFKVVIVKCALYSGGEVTSFNDDLVNPDLPEGMAMPIDFNPKKRRM